MNTIQRISSFSGWKIYTAFTINVHHSTTASEPPPLLPVQLPPINARLATYSGACTDKWLVGKRWESDDCGWLDHYCFTFPPLLAGGWVHWMLAFQCCFCNENEMKESISPSGVYSHTANGNVKSCSIMKSTSSAAGIGGGGGYNIINIYDCTPIFIHIRHTQVIYPPIIPQAC